MTDFWKRVISGLLAAIFFWILQAVVNRMPSLSWGLLAWDFFKTFWPVIGGGMVFLIYWAVQFFRRFKSENEKGFNSWLQAQELGLQNWRTAHERWIKESVKTSDQQIKALIAQSNLEQKAFANEVQSRLTKMDEKFENLSPFFPRRSLTPKEIERRVEQGEDFRIADKGPGPFTAETYTEITPTGKRQWTKEEIDKLSDTEKLKLKQNPDLWRWYLGG